MLVGCEVDMVQITIKVGEKPVELSVSEALAVRDQLNMLFGSVSTPFPTSPTLIPTIGSPIPPWTVTCGEAYGH